MCLDYNGGGKTDWFCPSWIEIEKMVQVLSAKGLGKMKSENGDPKLYWACEDYYYSESLDVVIDYGIYYSNGVHYGLKTAEYPVRAVRAF